MTRASAVLIALIALAPATASAAKDRPGRAFFERGEASFNRGRFEEARAEYQAAYDAEPLPAFLFNIGQCYRNMGDYERAQFFFQRYTVLEPRGPNRAAAEQLIAEMNRLARQRGGAGETEPGPDQPRAAPPLLASATSTAAPAPAVTDGPARLLDQPAADARGPASRPIYRRPWFWVGIGAAVVVGTALAFTLSREPPNGTLPSIDAR